MTRAGEHPGRRQRRHAPGSHHHDPGHHGRHPPAPATPVPAPSAAGLHRIGPPAYCLRRRYRPRRQLPRLSAAHDPPPGAFWLMFKLCMFVCFWQAFVADPNCAEFGLIAGGRLKTPRLSGSGKLG